MGSSNIDECYQPKHCRNVHILRKILTGWLGRGGGGWAGVVLVLFYFSSVDYYA